MVRKWLDDGDALFLVDLFWILLIVVLVALLLRRQSGEGSGTARPTAVEIIEHRYAAGEISTEEFEERKARSTRTPK